MTEKQKLYGVYGICLIFIVFIIFCILKDLAWVPLLFPMAIIVCSLYLYSFKKVLLLITFAVPFSVSLSDKEFGSAIGIPDEVLLIIYVLMYLFKICYDRQIDKDIVRHPVSICIFISLFWMFVTSITSELPMASFKYLAARLWFVIPCYFAGIRIFRDDRHNIVKYNWAYVISFLFVIVYTLINHYHHGFSSKSGLFVMLPFYPDHTCYGAMLVFMLPFLIFYAFDSDFAIVKRMLAFIVVVIYFVATYFSYTRAAWLSAAVAILVYLAFLLKIKFKYVVIVVACLIGIFFPFKDQILIMLQKNNNESSQNIVEQIESMTNISSDASNLERINRWHSAIRMFDERPVFGWGPGTYQFVYAPFQRSNEETIISTNAGDVGNCHSEYFGPLSEQGLPGLLLVFAFMIVLFSTGGHVYRNATDKKDKKIVLFCMLAFVTYYTHGLMNNFLDIDKAAVPFWLYAAIIVSLDLKVRKNDKHNTEKQLTEN